MTAPDAAPTPRRRRHWRIVRHTAGVIFLVLCLAVLGLVLALRNLDIAVVKQRLRALVKSQAGLELDYQSATADLLSGLGLRQLTLASPAFREIAPTLLKAGTLRLGWSLFGSGSTLRRITARDVELTIVVDEAGHTSLDPLLGRDQEKPEGPPIPPAQQLAEIVRGLPEFDRLAFSRVAVTVLQIRGGKVVARTRLAGIDLNAESRGEGKDRHVEIGAGARGQPLALTLTRDDGQPHTATPATPNANAPSSAPAPTKSTGPSSAPAPTKSTGPSSAPAPTGSNPPATPAKGKAKAKRAPAAPPQVAGPDAAGAFWLSAAIDGAAAQAHAELTLSDQKLSPVWPAKGLLLGVDTTARVKGDALEVALDRFEAIAGAIVLKGAVALTPGATRVDSAKGTLDLTRLARLAAEQVPVALREGHLKYDIAGLELVPAPRLAAGGHLDVDARAADLRIEGTTPADRAQLDEARLVVKGLPLPNGGLKLAVELPVGQLTVARAGGHLEVSHAALDLDAQLTPGAPGHAELHTRFDTLAAADRVRSVRTTHGQLDTRVTELELDPRHPAQLSATVASTARIDGLEASVPPSPGRRLLLHAADLAMTTHARVTNGAPQSGQVELPIGRFSVDGTGGNVVPPGPSRLLVRVDRIAWNAAAPARSAARAHIEAALAAMTLTADVGKQADAVDFDVHFGAERLALLTAFAPPALELPGAKMALTLATKGRLDHLDGTPQLKQHGSARLERPGITLAEEDLTAAALELTVDSDGSLQRQKLSFTLAEKALTLDEDPMGDGRIAARLAWDLPAHSVDIALDAEGQALPQGHLGLVAAFDHKTRALRYQVDADLGHLTALEPLLPTSLTDVHWIDLSDVRAQLHSHGTVTGLVTAVDARGVPTLAKKPFDDLSGEDEVSVQLTKFHYVDIAGVDLTVPEALLITHVTAKGAHRHADVEIKLPRATLVARGHKLDITDMHDHVVGDLEGSPINGPFELEHRFELGRFDQDWLPLYPIGGVVMTTHGKRLDDGTIQLDDFGWTNKDGGTTLKAKGSMLLARAQPRPRANVLTPVGFSSVALGLQLEQKLDAIKGDPQKFKGAGIVAVKARLASGDLRRYHTEATVSFRQASLTMPGAKTQIDDLDGALPLVEDFVLKQGATRVLPAQASNAYPQLRFSDQHAYQSKAGALRATRIKLGDVELTDLTASLRVARSQFAVDQLDAGLRKGRVAGSMLVDWRGPKSTAQLRLRMSGIEAKHGGTEERFDGNAALTLDMAERNIDGRVEILRIGRHHLYDLLDEYDPSHKDASTNRVRTALGLGYPQKVHLQFDRGFASMAVQFGGLARLLSVNEVQGIPTGPLIERYLGPLFAEENP